MMSTNSPHAGTLAKALAEADRFNRMQRRALCAEAEVVRLRAALHLIAEGHPASATFATVTLDGPGSPNRKRPERFG